MSSTFNFDFRMPIIIPRFQKIATHDPEEPSYYLTGSGFDFQLDQEPAGESVYQMVKDHPILVKQLNKMCPWSRITKRQLHPLTVNAIRTLRETLAIAQRVHDQTIVATERVLIARYAALSAIRSLSMFMLFHSRSLAGEVHLSNKNLGLLDELLTVISSVFFWYGVVLSEAPIREYVKPRRTALAWVMVKASWKFSMMTGTLRKMCDQDGKVRQASFASLVSGSPVLSEEGLQKLFTDTCIVF